MRLNCQSPKGREALEHNARALDKVSQQTGLQFLSFSSKQPSCADGIIVDGTTPISLFEVKSREMDLPKLEFEWGFRWMISEHKLLDNKEVSVRLKLPFTGILHCFGMTLSSCRQSGIQTGSLWSNGESSTQPHQKTSTEAKSTSPQPTST